jgi:uncharacterized repeat protein (TIGR02543 family)
LYGGENLIANPTSYTVTDEVIIYEPYRDGYIFDGWYTDSAFTKPILEIKKGTTGNKTLYAKWIVDTPKNRAQISANSYLDLMAFSYNGLINQLEEEGFTHDVAVFATNNCGANWKEQAIRSAKSYIKSNSYSYNGLINQLKHDGFTNEESIYGVDNCGANWMEQALISARTYLTYISYSYNDLLNLLEKDGFTHEEAVYAVDQMNLK